MGRIASLLISSIMGNIASLLTLFYLIFITLMWTSKSQYWYNLPKVIHKIHVMKYFDNQRSGLYWTLEFGFTGWIYKRKISMVLAARTLSIGCESWKKSMFNCRPFFFSKYLTKSIKLCFNKNLITFIVNLLIKRNSMWHFPM